MTSDAIPGVSRSARAPSGRGKAVLAVDWWPRALPDGTTVTHETLIAHDGDVSRGTLYRRGASATVFCLTHPRVDMRHHPSIPELLEQGYAVWAHAGRNVGNDLVLVHEQAVLDLGAGMEVLRQHGFERIVLVGFSGGAGLYTLYAEQSLAAPDERIACTPAGRPTKLDEAELPAPDALVLVAPHPGQGRLLLAAIDPSVRVEGDPLSLEPELDPFDPANGFGRAPEGSHYAEEFVTRYRAAQVARVRRIDERAHELVAAQRAARTQRKAGEGGLAEARIAITNPIITTYRTDADLRCTDRSLDANDRPYGSVISPRPDVTNYGVGGFGRLTTPESWLSTWSGESSNASIARSAQGVTVPTLVVEYTGDCSVFPSDIRSTLDALAAERVAHEQIRATHFGAALDEGAEDPMATTVRTILAWA